MARTLPPYDHLAEEEEDYIDMDISSATGMDVGSGNSFLCYTVVSPPHSNEFEFQMSVKPEESEATTSPADELFYKGKLLPLHIPPRLQMVEKLLKNSKETHANEEKASTTPITTSTTSSAPSCNICPACSRYVSGELNAEDYYKCSASLVRSNQKSSWCKKLKLIKQLSQSLKLKASKAYLKSLFNRRRCSDEPCSAQKANECSGGNNVGAAETKSALERIQIKSYLLDDTNALGLMRSITREKHVEEDVCHRKSFSGAMNWSLPTKNSSASFSSSSSSSSSSSFSGTSSNGFNLPLSLNGSGNVNSEVESSIQGAIAHCKKSQQVVSGRKSASDVGFYSLSAPIIAAACENQERPGLCRG